MVTYVRKSTGVAPVRFGFIVAKNVGGAVGRNRVRRRLKAASYDLLPTASDVPWLTLKAELSAALGTGGAR
jgi:ribonuclease P protein component